MSYRFRLDPTDWELIYQGHCVSLLLDDKNHERLSKHHDGERTHASSTDFGLWETTGSVLETQNHPTDKELQCRSVPKVLTFIESLSNTKKISFGPPASHVCFTDDPSRSFSTTPFAEHRKAARDCKVSPEFSQRSNHFDTFDPGVLQSPIIVCWIMM